MTLRRLILRTLLSGLVFVFLFFGTIDSFNWPRAWVFLGVMAVATIVSYSVLFPGHQDLLLERSHAWRQKGQPLVDKIFLIVYRLLFGFALVCVPLDVHRFHIFPRPGLYVSGVGLLLFLGGWWIVTLVFCTNPFAAQVIKHQAERRHQVITTGPYAIVRHPMYAALIPTFIGACLFLQSYAGALLMLLPLGMLAMRTVIEERFLKQKLEGYEEYTRKVRWRLIPYVW